MERPVQWEQSPTRTYWLIENQIGRATKQTNNQTVLRSDIIQKEGGVQIVVGFNIFNFITGSRGDY